MPTPTRAAVKRAPSPSTTGSVATAEADPTTSAPIPGATANSCRQAPTSAATSVPGSSTSVPRPANSTLPETTSTVRPWLRANGLPLEALELRSIARGVSLDAQLVGMIRYCLEHGVNGD